MGGYMGFGLQKWIYSRAPRKKLFVRERLPSFTSLPKYSRTFTLKPKVKENNVLKGILTIFIALAFCAILHSSYQKYTGYSQAQAIKLNDYQNNKDQIAFNFLINSGYNRLENNNVKAAYSEFKLAYNINSKNETLNKLMVETLMVLCDTDVHYCHELDMLLDVNNQNIK